MPWNYPKGGGATGVGVLYSGGLDATWRNAQSIQGPWTGPGNNTTQGNYVNTVGTAGQTSEILRDFGSVIKRANGYTVRATLQLVSVINSYGMLVCCTDEHNGYAIEFSSGGGNGHLYTLVAGVFTSIAALSGKAVQGDVMQVDLSATQITISKWTNGTKTQILAPFTDTTFDGTMFGFECFDTGQITFRDLFVG